MRFSRLVVCFMLACVVVPTGLVAGTPDLSIDLPSGVRVLLPYRAGALAAPEEISGAETRITECIEDREWMPGHYPQTRHEAHRSVSVTVPSSLDLLNGTIVNSLLLQALHVVWDQCYVPMSSWDKSPNYLGVQVQIVQNGQIIVQTDSLTRDPTSASGLVGFVKIEHTIADRIQAENRAKEAAAAAISRANFWRTVVLIFWIGVAVIVAIAVVRHGPKTLAYINYFFTPHPSNYLIDRATQGDRSRPVDGNSLVGALRKTPSNPIAAMLATRDMKKRTEKVETEIEYLRTSEELARKTVEMEMARARVEELKNAQEHS